MIDRDNPIQFYAQLKEEIRLAIEGPIRREKGRGTFVSGLKINEALARSLPGFLQDMTRQGRLPVSKVLIQAVRAASARTAGLLGFAADEAVVRSNGCVTSPANRWCW